MRQAERQATLTGQALGEICKVRRVALDLAMHSGIDHPPDALSVDDAMNGFLIAYSSPLGLLEYRGLVQVTAVTTPAASCVQA